MDRKNWQSCMSRRRLRRLRRLGVTAEAAKQQAQMAELKKRVEQGRVAMRDVVIPYFQELASGHVPAGTVQVQSRCAD